MTIELNKSNKNHCEEIEITSFSRSESLKKDVNSVYNNYDKDMAQDLALSLIEDYYHNF